MSEPPHARLEQEMNARRLELRMRWVDIARAAGISPEALRSIRRGDYRPTDLTAQAIDAALGWKRGSTHAVLDGGSPSLAPVGRIHHAELTIPAPPERRHDDLEQRPGETGKQYLVRMIELLIEEDSAEEEVLRQILETWRRRAG